MGSPNPSVKDAPGDLPETVLKIRQKRWAPEFITKAENLYNEFRAHGFELSDHAVGRLLDPERNSRFSKVSKDDIKALILNRKPNFVQPDGRLVIFDAEQHVAVIKSDTDNAVVTIVRRKYAGKTWNELK